MQRETASRQEDRPAQAADDWEDGVEAEEFKPLTREEAQQWRARQPQESVWRVVRWQAWLTLVAVVLASLLARNATAAGSALYGGLCILLPTALMAYGLTSSALARAIEKAFPGMARVSLAGVLFWEGIKVLLAIALLAAAPRLIPELSWLALMGGLVLALKAYWLEFWMRSRRKA